MSETYAGWIARSANAPKAEISRLVGTGGLVVLSPHPDDETFGASALLVDAGREGRAVGIVAVTDGEASHPGSRSVSRPALATIRQAEQEAAVRALGVGEARFLRLRLPDGGSGRDPRFADAAKRVAHFCDAIGATTLSAPHPDDPHPDHHATAALAAAVRELRPRLRLLYYFVWSMRLADETPYRGADLLPFRLTVDRAAKARATACHASQLGAVITDDPDGFTLPPWFLEAQTAPYEIHALAPMPGMVPPPRHFAELYADDGDPWHARSSRYEVAKRADNCCQLEGRRYERGLDIGCGEGHLAAELVDREITSAMTGLDRDAGIVARASKAYGARPELQFVTGALPEELPEGPFDLVVISEVLYFLDELALASLVRELTKQLKRGADILVVSYLGDTGTPLSGRAAHDLFVALFGTALTTLSLRTQELYQTELLRFSPRNEAAPADAGPSD
ncbi:bifunctional PIG-L family deacetylase/class I SAM-dependent methyltransferase [Jiella mangrovi]|uniref:Bifunctional PIG-L family deacetylase/class I SAM-dependent methyltransferase n=1 Tax=Jiella mangrovi TaxID=2821407 RepID=A0ABS4BCD8_9HYPH|nr:bifunctional PIG-L family deacetylase/class I SAM-dependent methyltransferase [Jiella mangrovi]MBP0614426.1 bifunctional PIG-L family deacetylase/class I SAM-dependent methyltransferase [Jiella mangrovi]